MDLNYFRVQARLIINFNTNKVEPRHTNMRLYDPLVSTTTFFRFKRRNQTYLIFPFSKITR